ncbi:transcription factor bHLH106-like protein [Cinnamomum micranthum f. kanehirae]|uniref:Transcription factor bHLH106-like protein n=1 Tax=Cinnamomum micranthum f. kanehirae TaxID=337451 RepID=A0A3S3M0C6_9MAGN|nr:transcription factor bHLH106-like protein [Cinnamomum micranthum f. kanehirae]
MQPANPPGTSEIYRILSQNRMTRVDPYASHTPTRISPGAPNPGPSFLPLEMATITDLPQPRSLSASINHKEAEKRRRERINSHLNELRKLLPCNSKTDKASLLARVVQHVKDLKQRTSEIAGSDLLPTETDEIDVFSDEVSGGGRSVFKASLCCEDRSDLLPDLIETLKSLRLRTIKAEMATLGGRVRNVLVVAGEDDYFQGDDSVGFLREALKALVERAADSERGKRRRMFDRRRTTD